MQVKKKVKNPKTGRNIDVGGPTFDNLLKGGYRYDEGREKLLPPGESLLSRITADELFIKIFKYLRPNDLLSLSRTCRTFRDILCSLENKTTQKIWKVSRHTFMPFLPSPRGIDEKSYICHVLKKKCQFCNKRTGSVRPYWAFNVYSCRKCIKDGDGTCTYDHQLGLPYETVSEKCLVRGYVHYNYYWKEDVDEALKKYNELSSDEEKDEWYQKGRERMLDIKIRDMTNDFDPTTKLNYIYENLIRCPSYESARENKLAIDRKIWESLKNELIREYSGYR